MHYAKNCFPFIIIFLDSSHAQEVSSTQGTSCSQQTISSTQQPSCSSDGNIYINVLSYVIIVFCLAVHALCKELLSFYYFFLDSSHAQEVCSTQDTSCSQQTISSTQQPICSSDIINSSSQVTGYEADTNTFQGTSSSKLSAVHEVIDLSQYSTPSMPTGSVKLSGL